MDKSKRRKYFEAMKKTHIFLIVDGHALLHRAWHAIPPLITKNGITVNAAYGFISILLKTLKELKPAYVAITFDPPGGSFRHEKFPAYKAHREKQPDELYAQIPIIKEIITAFGFPFFEVSGFEADDVIGTISKKLKAYYGMETIILTGDMDTLQLIDKTTKVLTPKKTLSETSLYDEEAVFARYGLKPDQLIDFKALRGDPSDNIPGVSGIGEKTAEELIKQFSTLENLYKNREKITLRGTRRVKELLEKHKKEAFLSKELVTILRDVPLKFYYESCQIESFDRKKITDIFSQYEFTSLLKRLDDILPNAQPNLFSQDEKKVPRNPHYHLVADKKSFDVFFKQLSKEKIFAFDSESTGLDLFSDHIIGLSFCWAEESYYVQLNIPEGKYFLEKLQKIFEDPQYKKVGQNIKFDWHMLKGTNISVENLYADTMVASYLLNPGTRGHGLDNLAFVEFGHEMIHIEELIGKGKNQISMDQVNIEKVYPYAAEDADYTWKLWEIFKPRLKDQNIEKLFYEIEMPLVEVLGFMEQAGVAIDVSFLESMNREIEKEIEKVTREIHKMAGYPFNIASPQQLGEVLFEKLGLSSKDIKKGKMSISTAEAELEKLRGTHPIIEHILSSRELLKLKNTYLDALPRLVHPITKRVHTSFNQTIASTGRLSSSHPNLQNIPIRTELGRKIRKAFIAEEGYTLLSADYSQIELRIVAALSNDAKMIGIFQRGEDIHRATAAEINGVSLEMVTPEMRYAAKEINFGVLYGMGAYGLSRRARISHEEAKKFINTYFEKFEGVRKFLDATIESAKEKGYVETLFGRKRLIPEIHSGVYQIRAAAERMAVNMPVQGTAADLMKIAMNKIHARLKKEYSKDYQKNIKMILQVHDELVFEIKNSLLPKISKLVKKEMEEVAKLGVPIIAELKIGPNWSEMEKL